MVYDLNAQQWTMISPGSVVVIALAGPPDGERLAFAGSAAEPDVLSYMYNDLYIADLRKAGVEKIPLRAGFNSDPLWSPDGQQWSSSKISRRPSPILGRGASGALSMVVTHGHLSYLGTLTKSGAWRDLERFPLHGLPAVANCCCAYRTTSQGESSRSRFPRGTCSRSLRMTTGTFMVPAMAITVAAFFFLERLFSLSRQNIYASPADRFDPQPVTHIESGVNHADVEVRQLSWPSRDGHLTIHGWLLLPKAPSGQPLPLLVFAQGGPSMISPEFRMGWQCPLHAFLANGVAVLIPNSRGRGGYGVDFQTTWEKERNPGDGPLQDDLDGVDYLVKSGIADSDRVGLAGFSWGGYLAAYALTHTDRFKAILVNEAVSLNMMEEGLAIAGNPPYIEFARQLGKGMPFDDDDADRLRRLSPVYQTASAKTPALLEFGANSLIGEGAALFQGLRHFNVPSELISYPRSGHGAVEPALIYDSARRDLEWFAYWVLGKPTQRMLERYGPAPISEMVSAGH